MVAPGAAGMISACGRHDRRARVWGRPRHDTTTGLELSTAKEGRIGVAAAGVGQATRIPALRATAPIGLRDLTFSPDGQRLADAGILATLWDSHTGWERTTLPATPQVFAVAFAPDGQSLAVGGSGQGIQLRSAATHAIERTIELTDSLFTLAFSPDGQLLSAGTRRAVHVWNVADGTVHATLPTSSEIYSVVFSPNGRLLAAAGAGGEITIWSVPGFTNVHTFQTVRTYQLAFSPDSQLLAAAQLGATLTVWRMADDAPVWSWGDPARGEMIWNVTFTADGNYVRGGSDSGLLRAWRVADGSLHSARQFNTPVRGLAMAADGQTQAIGVSGGTVLIWRWPMTGQTPATPDN